MTSLETNCVHFRHDVHFGILKGEGGERVETLLPAAPARYLHARVLHLPHVNLRHEAVPEVKTSMRVCVRFKTPFTLLLCVRVGLKSDLLKPSLLARLRMRSARSMESFRHLRALYFIVLLTRSSMASRITFSARWDLNTRGGCILVRRTTYFGNNK